MNVMLAEGINDDIITFSDVMSTLEYSGVEEPNSLKNKKCTIKM